MAKYKLKTIFNKNFKPIRFRRSGKPHYQIFLEIEPDEVSDLKNVENVEYFLHPTFKNRIRNSSDRKNNFRVEIKAWGTFVVRIKIYESSNSVEEFTQNMKDNWVESYI